MKKNKLQQIYNYNKICKLIEKKDSIISVQGFKCAKIDNIGILIELGKSLYNVVSGYILYDKFYKYEIDVREIDKIVASSQKDVNNEVYITWLKQYDEDDIKLRYFSKEFRDYHVYILMSILYLECGIAYMFSVLSDMICNRLYHYFTTKKEKDYFNDIDSCLPKGNVDAIANLLSIGEDYYYYKELSHLINFSSLNDFKGNNIATYLGICVTEFLTITYVLKKYSISNVKELKYKKGLILNFEEFYHKIPKEVYNNLRINEESIGKLYNDKIIFFSKKIYRPFFTVITVKNIIGMMFANYILYNDDVFLRMSESILARFANVELSKSAIKNRRASKCFLYYYATVNNLTYIHRPFQKGHMGNNVRVTNKDDSENKLGHVLADITELKSADVYKKVLDSLYNNCLCLNHLLRDELKIYNIILNEVEDSSNKVNNRKDSTAPKITVQAKSNPYQHNKNIDFCDRKNTLYIMKRTSTCQSRNHNVIAVTGILKNLRGFSVKINVNYCENCKKFFINKMDFDEFCKRHGIMLGNFSVKELNLGKGFNGIYKLADESPLHYCGYNVNKQKGLTESDRHKILANIIDFNIMKKTEIIEYLHFYINNIGNRANMNFAVSKWEDDLYFVNNYRINKQKSYRIDKIRQK